MRVEAFYSHEGEEGEEEEEEEEAERKKEREREHLNKRMDTGKKHSEIPKAFLADPRIDKQKDALPWPTPPKKQ